MTEKQNLTVRSAGQEDQRSLAQLVHFETFVHRHLDYRAPLDWLGSEPFLVLEQQERVEAALVCPPDPPKVAWIRLFAASRQLNPQKAWETMWWQAKEKLSRTPSVVWAAAIPLQNWFRSFLEKSQFSISHHIVMMKWERQPIKNGSIPSWLSIRSMMPDDLSAILIVDEASFIPVWQNSLISLEVAFRQAGIATVAEVDGHIVGYQISTPTHMGGHLARLAVLPAFQGQGLGKALLLDLLTQFERRGALVVSVNTQKDNQASLSLYKNNGFKYSGEEYPIFQYEFVNAR